MHKHTGSYKISFLTTFSLLVHEVLYLITGAVMMYSYMSQTVMLHQSHKCMHEHAGLDRVTVIN